MVSRAFPVAIIRNWSCFGFNEFEGNRHVGVPEASWNFSNNWPVLSHFIATSVIDTCSVNRIGACVYWWQVTDNILVIRIDNTAKISIFWEHSFVLSAVDMNSITVIIYICGFKQVWQIPQNTCNTSRTRSLVAGFHNILYC